MIVSTPVKMASPRRTRSNPKNDRDAGDAANTPAPSGLRSKAAQGSQLGHLQNSQPSQLSQASGRFDGESRVPSPPHVRPAVALALPGTIALVIAAQGTR